MASLSRPTPPPRTGASETPSRQDGGTDGGMPTAGGSSPLGLAQAAARKGAEPRARGSLLPGAKLPEELLVSAHPRYLLWRSIGLLFIIVVLPSVIYNLLLPTLAGLESIQGQVVVIISIFVALAWLALFLYFCSLYSRTWRTDPRFAMVLGVLTFDAFRNVIESAYFGVAYSGWIQWIPGRIMRLLWAPQLIIITRLLTLATALIILWLVVERGFDNLMLREQRSLLLEQRNRELTALQQLASMLSGTLETESVLASVCRETVETLHFDSALLCLVDEHTRTIRGAAGYAVPTSLIEDTVRDLSGDDILANIVKNGTTEVLTGWDDRFHQETYERYQHESQIRVFAPIRDAQGTVGAVQATVNPDRSPPDQHQLAMLHSFLTHACTAIRNARLHERVLRDRERLNDLTLSLEDKNKQLEGFVYMISHDLKAPLVSIQGFVSLLDAECARELGEDGAFYLARVRSNAKHLQGLIQQLLELSRIGRVDGSRAWVDLDEMTREIVETMRPRLVEADVSIDAHGPLPKVFGEPTQIRQLLVNLMDNSIKYMGSSVERRIEIKALQTPQDVELMVSDTGIGIPGHLQERVFQMFQRIVQPDENIEGSGVGLAIVRKIAEAHGGRAWVESEGAGKGSCFHACLHRAGSPAGPSAEPQESETG